MREPDEIDWLIAGRFDPLCGHLRLVSILLEAGEGDAITAGTLDFLDTSQDEGALNAPLGRWFERPTRFRSRRVAVRPVWPRSVQQDCQAQASSVL